MSRTEEGDGWTLPTETDGSPQLPAGTETVNLHAVHVNPSYIVRKTDPRTVRSYVNMLKAGGVPPPVTVALINGVLTLLCGQHRRAAAMEFSISHAYPAKIIEVSATEAHWIAAQDNLRNGRQLTPQEKFEVVRRYIKAGKHRDERGKFQSYREMHTNLVGVVALSTLHKIVRKEFPKLARALGGYHDEPRGTGGCHKATPRPEVHFREHLQQAHTCLAGELDPVARQRCYDEAVALVKAIERSGPRAQADF